jgi:hypothetical protein
VLAPQNYAQTELTNLLAQEIKEDPLGIGAQGKNGTQTSHNPTAMLLIE